MFVDELRASLQHHDIPAIAYSLGRDKNESYCLVMEDDRWHVYYSERGNRNAETMFASESDACKELLRRVLEDGSVQSLKAKHQR
jgi:hypothetical protein